MADGNKWANLLDDLASGSGGPFFFPKSGRTRFRIVPADGENGSQAEEWFRAVDSTFRGRTKTKFILRVIVTQTDQGDLSDQYRDKIVPMVISKSAFNQVIEILAAEDFPLLELESGHQVAHNRQGEGMNTSYTIMPSPKPFPIDLDDYEIPDESMDDWAEAFIARESNRTDSTPASSNEDTGW